MLADSESSQEKKTESGRAEVVLNGDSNFVIAPVAVNDYDNVILNSLKGMVGQAIEITTGGYSIKDGKISFNYTEEELKKLGIKEEDLDRKSVV